MSEKTLRVLLTGGGSGGPTIPLLALADELKKQQKENSMNCEFLFLGSKLGPEKEMVEKTDIPFQSIPSGKLRRYWSWQNFVDPWRIMAGGLAGLAAILRFKPNVVVSAGSFVSVPVSVAAWLMKVPHVILQMDVRPGLANRLMAPFSQALAFHLTGTEKHFPAISRKKQIGAVVRDEILKADPENANTLFSLKADMPLILITGGGQGAAGLNRAVQPLLQEWLKSHQVVHLTGKGWDKDLVNHENYHAIEFVHEGMGDLLSRSNVVLTRAGMGILGELAALKKESVLIPLPGTHQEQNAALLAEKKSVHLISQKELAENGIEWWQNEMQQKTSATFGENLNRLLPATGKSEFAELILELSDKNTASSQTKRDQK